MLRIGYWAMMVIIIILMAVIILQTSGAFGATIGMLLVGYLIYKNNKGEF